MNNPKMVSLLNSVNFKPVKIYAVKYGRDRFNRQQYVPMVECELGGSPCKLVPMDLGLYSSPTEAVRDAEKWAELV